jgi:predicted nucleotidyltransferase
MKLHHFLDDIFGSKSKIRILRLMFRYPQREFTEREMAKHIGMSQNTVNLALTDLRKTNIMSYRRIGKANVYTLNRNSVMIPYISQIYRNEKKVREDMIHRIKKATNTYISCILFGSFANNSENFESDLDLLIVVKEKRKVRDDLGRLEDEFLKLYGTPLEIVLLTPRELINKWNSSYMKEARKNNVVINGKTLEELYGEGHKNKARK